MYTIIDPLTRGGLHVVYKEKRHIFRPGELNNMYIDLHTSPLDTIPAHFSCENFADIFCLKEGCGRLLQLNFINVQWNWRGDETDLTGDSVHSAAGHISLCSTTTK